MTPVQEDWWRIALELKLRKASANAFQEFFSSLMGKLHGDDFVSTRPFGVLGDKGCDGYLQSTGEVFQCYGALNGDSGKVAYLIGKMDEDYAKAAEALLSIMKAWTMVHNLVDGLPIEAVEKLEGLRKSSSGCRFAFLGLEGFEQRLFSLEDRHIEALLGVAANNQDMMSLQAAELRDLVVALMQAADDTSPAPVVIGPVPVDKLQLNKLPGHWCRLIEGGWQNAHLVGEYLARHRDPMTGEKIAQIFRHRYSYLKSQGLQPAAIMTSLYGMVTGSGTVSAPRQVAAQALLAYLFESCDIFEDDASKVPA